jgi:hypothetical protein
VGYFSVSIVSLGPDKTGKSVKWVSVFGSSPC